MVSSALSVAWFWVMGALAAPVVNMTNNVPSLDVRSPNSGVTTFGTIGSACVPLSYACDSDNSKRVLICNPNSNILEVLDEGCDGQSICQFIGSTPYCVNPGTNAGATPMITQSPNAAATQATTHAHRTQSKGAVTTSTKMPPPTVVPKPATTGPLTVAAPTSGTPVIQAVGQACGYQNLGTLLQINPQIQICQPPVVCNPETCPPALGSCTDNQCQFHGGYQGLKTLPQAWATYYCDLAEGGCHGITQDVFPEVTAAKVGQQLGLPLCGKGVGPGTACVGIAAAPPMMIGNSQVATNMAGDFVHLWGLGLSEASNVCYQLTGPGGTVVVALTDRCGGFCKCNGSGFQECGACVNSPSLTPNCACVGAVPGLYSTCCGNNCNAPVVADCDWCASNNHPHFDVDMDAFTHLCGSLAAGTCQISEVKPISCPLNAPWPPSN